MEGAPKFNSVPENEARQLSPSEIAEAQQAVEAMSAKPEGEVSQAEAIERAIANEEAYLQSNIAENEAALIKADAVFDNPAMRKADAKGVWSENQRRIGQAYEKAKGKITAISLSTGYGGFLSGTTYALLNPETYRGVDMHIASAAGIEATYAGLGVAAASAAGWAIARGMNWLSKRRQREQNWQDYQAKIA